MRNLLGRAVHRLEGLCAIMLHRDYPRLARPPSNLETDEMLGGVVEGLLKAMDSIRPQTVRHFFALANQHMRWQLNDLARRMDERPVAVELSEELLARPGQQRFRYHPGRTPDVGGDRQSAGGRREVFGLVRLQGLTHAEAAEVLDVRPRRCNDG